MQHIDLDYVRQRFITVLKQRPREAQLTDEKVVLTRFVGRTVMQFIRSQRISLWWNSAARTEKCSAMFNAGLLAGLDGNLEEAARLRRAAIFGLIKWPVVAGIIIGLGLSWIPFLWILIVIGLVMLEHRLAWFFYAEAEFLHAVLEKPLPKPDDQNWPFSLLPMNPEGGRYRRFLRGVREGLPRSRLLARAYSAFAKMRDAELEYARMPVKNCVVCATMSAGKSTFVNALLGMDVLPSRNGAATAKITSVYDRDGEKGLIGFTMDAAGIFTGLCDDVDLSCLDKWNADDNVSQVYLKGDFDGIPNQGFRVAVHDTPGTNNSGDGRHHDATMEFLRRTRVDMIIYVANAEQLSTTDDKALLMELLSEVVTPYRTPVLFVMNKADSIDTQKESVEAMVDQYRSFLSGIGFVDPIICPMSSKAARLLKMALSGRSGKFSETECDDFPLVVRKFTKRMTFDRSEVRRVDEAKYDERVSVDGEVYDRQMLCVALSHTGVHAVEYQLEKLLTNIKE